ncbi:F-box/kelch-repeat protein At3g06240-like [Quercus suber]|uniref:F-box/kelch-repeat protein At3g06240-like n=1 Tax=Quercus suber TaxID=58331 RepID=UPI0032DE9A55
MPLNLRSTNRSICTVALDRTFDTISEARIPFDFSSNFAQIVGSCNGLLCIADYGNVRDIYLWNPSIRKFKKLPHPCLSKPSFALLGFAYHSQNNDYKVVRISSSLLSLHEIEVYTLSLDSWGRVGFNLKPDLKFFDKDHFLPTPLVSGDLHWIAVMREGEENHKNKNMIMLIVRKLALPHVSVDANNLNRCLASFKGKLAFITSEHSEQLGFRHSIWVMREYGVVESWTKLFVVPFPQQIDCIAFTEYGSLLTFCFIHSSPLDMQKYELLLIDAKTLQQRKDPDIQYLSSIAAFMESLVLLDGANMVSY